MNIANVARFGTGFIDGLRLGEDMVQRARERRAAAQYTQELADANKAATLNTRETMVGGKPDTMDNSDVGQPGEAPVQAAMQKRFDVAGKSYDSEDAAKKALADYNSSTAKGQRIADVIAKRDPVKAQQYLTNVMDTEEKQKLRAAKEFDAQLMGVTDFQGLTDWMSASHADGMGGNMKFAHNVGQDGKVTFALVGPDGQQKPLPYYAFENNAKGLQSAQLMLARSIPVEDKLKHIMAEREAAQKEKYLDIQMRNALNDDRRADARLGMEGQRLQWQGQETAMQLQRGYQSMGQDNARFSWDMQDRVAQRDKDFQDALVLNKDIERLRDKINAARAGSAYTKDAEGVLELKNELSAKEKALKEMNTLREQQRLQQENQRKDENLRRYQQGYQNSKGSAPDPKW